MMHLAEGGKKSVISKGNRRPIDWRSVLLNKYFCFVFVALAAFLAVVAGDARAASLAARSGPVAGPVAGEANLHQVAAKKRLRKRRSRRRSRRSRSRGTALPTPPGSASAALGKRRDRDGGTDKLFGTTETRSTKFRPFKKWTGAMARAAEEQADTAVFAKRFKKWVVFLDGLKGKSKLDQVKAVNKFMNKSKYIQDNKNWGVKDYWASPGEFINKFGDCEDYAIAKYMALKYLGHDPQKMRIVAVKDMNLKVGHAILAYYTGKKILILDNQIKIVADSRKIRHYKPVYSINEKYWWRHRG